MKHFLAIVAAAMLVLTLCGCTEEVRASKAAARRVVELEEVTMVAEPSDLRELGLYPNLRFADLRGSTCYDEIEKFIARYPKIEVIYTIDIGGTEVSPDVKALELREGDYNMETLKENMQYLHGLQTLSFPDVVLDSATVTVLQELCPGLEVFGQMTVNGEVCDQDIEFLDLSEVTPEQVESIAQDISHLTNLKEVELMAEDGTALLSVEEVGILQKAAPDTLFHYTFKLFDKVISTTDEEISYANKFLGNKEGAEETLRQALDIMKGCKRLVLDNCHFTNEVMAQIRDDYRGQTKVVWRVWFGKEGGCLTDREMIRHVYGLTASNCTNLMYCEDAKYIDVGHNDSLFNVDFVKYMPNLEAIIVSGAPIKDLSAFENCKNLKFLEIAYCGYIEDLSPLANCTSLERLNIASTAVTDLSPLDNLNMVVLVDANSDVPEEEQAHFDAKHPQCLVQHSGDQPYGYPWRYNEDESPNEYYGMLKEIFDYAHGQNTRY